MCTLRRMAVRASTVTVTGASPQVIADAESSLDGASGSVLNSGAQAIFLGGDDMTVGNVATKGFSVAVGASVDFDLVAGEQLFACVSSGSGQASILANRMK